MDVEHIFASIKNLRDKEEDNRIYDPAFGRYEAEDRYGLTTFWIVLERTTREHDNLLSEDNNIYVSRDSPVGSALIQNTFGEHKLRLPGGVGTIKIFNKAKYTPVSNLGLANDITISDSDNEYSFRTLHEALTALASSKQEILKIEEKLEIAKSAQNDTNVQQLRGELEKAKEERAYIGIQRFVRQYAALRWQPILDPEQDAIKCTKIFDGGTLVIDGGPGTGKTTTLVQRIKFLISKTIEEQLSLADRHLSKSHKEIIFSHEASWVFFSPSELLASFLKDTMAKEKLPAGSNTVKVWSTHRDAVTRLYDLKTKDEEDEEEDEREDEEDMEKDRKKEQARIFYTMTEDSLWDSPFINPNKNATDIIKNFYRFYFERQQGRVNHKGFDITIDANSIDFSNVNTHIRDLFQKHCDFSVSKFFESKLKKYQQSDDYKFDTKLVVDNKKGQFKKDSYTKAFNKTLVFLLDDIPKAYTAYRKKLLKDGEHYWNTDALHVLAGGEKQYIHFEEQNFLIYVINIFCRNLYLNDPLRFQESKKRSVVSYRTFYKPVIAIDEATDFSTLDLLAMHSFRHPEISSVTLSGDLMQSMTTGGLKSWECFSNVVDSSQIKNLNVSYRQSPTLLSIAQNICRLSTGIEAEYKSYMASDPSEPKPLLKLSNDENEKIRWIAKRVREVDKIYSQSKPPLPLPSVAVFVPHEDDISDFVKTLKKHLDGDIPVQGCPEGRILGDNAAVRVYAVDKIKGLEFEAVFFHNLDHLKADHDLLLRYLYVGLSRAAFYLGVTLSKRMDGEFNFFNYDPFSEYGNWDHSNEDGDE